MNTLAIILAGGKALRMGGESKAFLPLGVFSALERALMPFLSREYVKRIVIVGNEEEIDAIRNVVAKYDNKPITVVVGGDSRTASSRNGIREGVRRIGDISSYLVAIHDVARPFFTAELLDRLVAEASKSGSAIPVVDVVDTIRDTEGTLDRTKLKAVQTPQVFNLEKLFDATTKEFGSFTDDAGLYEKYYGKVSTIEGETANRKMTYITDIPSFCPSRVGIGEDLHRLAEGRKLILCGVEIPHGKGLLGHSDADVALHAIMDAILSALSLWDIGRLFPDTDPQYKGVSSVYLLHEVMVLMEARGYEINNLALVIGAEQPKLSPYRKEMQDNLALLLDIAPEDIGITFKTGEGVGYVGREEGITAKAIISLTEI